MRRVALLAVALTWAGPAGAQTPAAAIDASRTLIETARAAQHRIDGLARERQRVLDDLRVVELDGTADAVRVRELEQTMAAVRADLVEIEADLAAVTDTQTGIVALLARMIDSLERFVELDLPFRLAERRAAIAGLRAALGRADVSVAEKYQAVVSAYLDEIRFGHSNGVVRERIATPSGTRFVDVLRLGRAGLWYVTPDGSQAGRWDAALRRWTEGDTSAAEVAAGITAVRTAGSVTVRLPVLLDVS